MTQMHRESLEFVQGCLLLPSELPQAQGVAVTLLQQRTIKHMKMPSTSLPPCAVIAGSSGAPMLATAEYMASVVQEVDSALASATEPVDTRSMQIGDAFVHRGEMLKAALTFISQGGSVALKTQAETASFAEALASALPELQAGHAGAFEKDASLFVPSSHADSQKQAAIVQLRTSGFLPLAEVRSLQLQDAMQADPALKHSVSGEWAILSSAVDQVATAVIAELDPSEGAVWCDAAAFLPSSCPPAVLQAFMEHTTAAIATQLGIEKCGRLDADKLAAWQVRGGSTGAPPTEELVLHLLGSAYVSREWALQLAQFLAAHGTLEQLLDNSIQENRRVRADLIASLRAADTQVSIAQLSLTDASSPTAGASTGSITRDDSIGSFVMVDVDEAHTEAAVSPRAAGPSESEAGAAAAAHLAAMKVRQEGVQNALSVWDACMKSVLNAQKYCNARAIEGCSDDLPLLCFEDASETLALAVLQQELLGLHVAPNSNMARVFHAVQSQLSGDLLVLGLTQGEGLSVGPATFGGTAGAAAAADSLLQVLRTSVPGGMDSDAITVLHPVVLATAEVVYGASRAAARAVQASFAEVSAKIQADKMAGEEAVTVSPQLGGLPSHPPVERQHALWAAHVTLVACVDAAAPLARGCAEMAVSDSFPRIPHDHWSTDLVQAQDLAHKLAAQHPWVAGSDTTAAPSDGLVQTVHNNLQRCVAQAGALEFNLGLSTLVSDILLLRAVACAGKAAPGALSALALSSLGLALAQLQVQLPGSAGADAGSPGGAQAFVFPSGLPLLAAYMPKLVALQAQMSVASSDMSPALPEELLSSPQRDALVAWFVHAYGPVPSNDGSPASLAMLHLTRVDSSASAPASGAAADDAGDFQQSGLSPVLRAAGNGREVAGDASGASELAHLLALRRRLLHLTLQASESVLEGETETSGSPRQRAFARVPVMAVFSAVEAATLHALPTPPPAADASDSEGASDSEDGQDSGKQVKRGGKKGGRRDKGAGKRAQEAAQRKALPRGRKGKGSRASPWVGKHRKRAGTGMELPLAQNSARVSGSLTSLASIPLGSSLETIPRPSGELAATVWAVLSAVAQDDIGVGGQVELLLPVLHRQSQSFSMQWGNCLAASGQAGGSAVSALARSIIDDKDKKLKREHKAEHSAALHALGLLASETSGTSGCGHMEARVSAVHVGRAAHSTLGVAPVCSDEVLMHDPCVIAILLLSSARVEQRNWTNEWHSCNADTEA